MSDTKPLRTEIGELLLELEGQATSVEHSFVNLESGVTANAAVVVKSLDDLTDGVTKIRESLTTLPVVHQARHG